MSKTVTIQSTPDTHERHGNRIDFTLAVDSGRGYHHRFGVGLVPEGDEGRQVFQGPMVPGPWAYAFGLCSVIDNHGGTGAERQRNLTAKTEADVQEGDTVIIDGLRFIVKIERREFLKLIAQ